MSLPGPQHSDSPLFNAIQRGDMPAVRQLLASDPAQINQTAPAIHGCPARQINLRNSTPIVQAFAHNQIAIGQFLADEKADLSVTPGGVTPLDLAVLNDARDAQRVLIWQFHFSPVKKNRHAKAAFDYLPPFLEGGGYYNFQRSKSFGPRLELSYLFALGYIHDHADDPKLLRTLVQPEKFYYAVYQYYQSHFPLLKHCGTGSLPPQAFMEGLYYTEDSHANLLRAFFSFFKGQLAKLTMPVKVPAYLGLSSYELISPYETVANDMHNAPVLKLLNELLKQSPGHTELETGEVESLFAAISAGDMVATQKKVSEHPTLINQSGPARHQLDSLVLNLENSTPVIEALAHNQPQIALWLMDQKADVSVTPGGLTALDFAVAGKAQASQACLVFRFHFDPVRPNVNNRKSVDYWQMPWGRSPLDLMYLLALGYIDKNISDPRLLLKIVQPELFYRAVGEYYQSRTNKIWLPQDLEPAHAAFYRNGYYNEESHARLLEAFFHYFPDALDKVTQPISYRWALGLGYRQAPSPYETAANNHFNTPFLAKVDELLAQRASAQQEAKPLESGTPMQQGERVAASAPLARDLVQAVEDTPGEMATPDMMDSADYKAQIARLEATIAAQAVEISRLKQNEARQAQEILRLKQERSQARAPRTEGAAAAAAAAAAPLVAPQSPVSLSQSRHQLFVAQLPPVPSHPPGGPVFVEGNDRAKEKKQASKKLPAVVL